MPDYDVLRKYARLRRELVAIQSEIKAMYTPVKSPAITSDGAQHNGLPSSPTEKALSYIERLRRKEEMKAAEIEAVLNEIDVWRDSIDDPDIRAIVRYKYVQELSWSQTAKAMYGIDAGDTVRKKFHRYLKEHGK